MSAYYNEIDPYCAQWLRNLIAAGHIADGEVDQRDIREVSADDLRGFAQCHFFAGIGGWSYALRLAGWPDDRPVWTGSCPCQPFSAAGRGKASGDERHLWPEWFRLIRAARPPVIFGEQVEAAIGWGWLDLVHTDLEPEGYTVRSAVLPACSVGAPHIRQRLWFVGHAECNGAGWDTGTSIGAEKEASVRAERDGSRPSSADGWLADAECPECRPYGERRRGFAGASPWHDLLWLPCTDGKQRPTQPGIFPLAHGLRNRVAQLRAAGNAIVPQAAAEFIKSAMS